MSPRLVGVLLERELVRGSKSFFFIFAVIIPLAITLIVSLIFGTLISQKPKLGIADEGDSALVELAAGVDSLVLREFLTAAELREAVSGGAVDIGLVLPAGFDDILANGETAQVSAFIWGESLVKNRAILGTTIAYLFREAAGHESPVEIVTTTVGEGESIPWADRLLPFIVLMAVIIGGVMLPASSIVDEKQHRTLTALVTTPASLADVLVSKGAVGALISLIMGVLILLLNQALGGEPLTLVLILALGAVFAATFGVLLGVLIKDINSLFATVKGLGILLYAPALIYLFPGIPQWIGRLFPTYYIVQPVVEITQEGAGLQDVVADVLVLVTLTVLLIGVVSLVSSRARPQPA